MRVNFASNEASKGTLPPKEDGENRLFLYQERTLNMSRSFKRMTDIFRPRPQFGK
jgi:hypothetical protein